MSQLLGQMKERAPALYKAIVALQRPSTRPMGQGRVAAGAFFICGGTRSVLLGRPGHRSIWSPVPLRQPGGAVSQLRVRSLVLFSPYSHPHFLPSYFFQMRVRLHPFSYILYSPNSPFVLTTALEKAEGKLFVLFLLFSHTHSYRAPHRWAPR